MGVSGWISAVNDPGPCVIRHWPGSNACACWCTPATNRGNGGPPETHSGGRTGGGRHLHEVHDAPRGEQGAAPDRSNAGEARARRGGRARPVRDWARPGTSDGVERARGAAGGVRK